MRLSILKHLITQIPGFKRRKTVEGDWKCICIFCRLLTDGHWRDQWPIRKHTDEVSVAHINCLLIVVIFLTFPLTVKYMFPVISEWWMNHHNWFMNCNETDKYVFCPSFQNLFCYRSRNICLQRLDPTHHNFWAANSDDQRFWTWKNPSIEGFWGSKPASSSWPNIWQVSSLEIRG